jgi:hypothetical protein
MTGLLSLLALRPLLAKPMRLAACFVAGIVLLTVPDLLLRRYLDADLPRIALLALLTVLAAAWLFLRAGWRRRPRARGTPWRRLFARRSAASPGNRTARNAVLPFRRPS